MALKNELQELVSAGVIDKETANRIGAHLSSRRPATQFTIFGILGAFIIGLGVILIIAHNWDDLSRMTRTAFAFLPLVLGQGLAAFALMRKNHDPAWNEGSSVFVACGVGASLSLVSQIYNIPGSLNSFMSTWMLLILPLAYIMRSCATSAFYIVGISIYGTSLGYWSGKDVFAWQYWLLLAAVVPHYISVTKKHPSARLTRMHHWLIPLSIAIMLGSIADDHETVMYVGYMAFFGILLCSRHLVREHFAARTYSALGSVGIVVLLLAASFDTIWKQVYKVPMRALWSVEALVSGLLVLLSIGLYLKYRANRQPADVAVVAFPLIFLLGCVTPLAVVAVNLLLLLIGLTYIRTGLRSENIVLLNFGLFAIGALILCRFFDSDLSFVVRGISFIAVGCGFIGANLYLIKKRKNAPQ